MNRTIKLARTILPLVLVTLLPTFAHAHVGGSVNGLWHGFAHPITGLDHLTAMIAVGLWAAQRGGRAFWLVPLAFVTVMGVGAAIGMAAIALPFVEPMIAASVLVLGLLIAMAIRLPLAASTILVGLFALFHGHAHGSEMPATASGFAYAIGFMIATVALHLTGIAIGTKTNQAESSRVLRYAGGAIAICGLFLCVVQL